MRRSRLLSESISYAISGMIYAFKTQRNIKIHFLAALVILAVSHFLKLDTMEFLVVLITITLVLTAEMVNTAVETVVDMYTKEFHPLAKVAKNVAAGAVLISAINALIVGYLIYFNKILILFNLY